MEMENHVTFSKSSKWMDWIYMTLFLVILGVTWLLNLYLLLGIHWTRKRRLQQFASRIQLESSFLPNYYFIISISIANILAVSFSPPIYIVYRWLNFNDNPLWRIYCLISICTNTIFCNLAFLHVLFSSLDTFLRLYSPRLYIFSQRATASGLKISAPWLVTCIQAGCQLSISNKNSIRSVNLQCLVDDVNFLILRSVISFAVPLLACVVLIILQMYFLRSLSRISDENMRYLLSTYLKQSQQSESLPLRERTPPRQTSIEAEHKVNRMYSIPRDVTGETLASLQSNMSDPTTVQFSPHSGPLHLAIDYTANHLDGKTDKSPPSPKTYRQNSNANSEAHISEKRSIWTFLYQREQLSVALNMASCIVAIGIWSPLILTTLTYRLCEQSSCFFQVPMERISDFTWWSFAGGTIYPIAYLSIDKNLRKTDVPFCSS